MKCLHLFVINTRNANKCFFCFLKMSFRKENKKRAEDLGNFIDFFLNKFVFLRTTLGYSY